MQNVNPFGSKRWKICFAETELKSVCSRLFLAFIRGSNIDLKNIPVSALNFNAGSDFFDLEYRFSGIRYPI